MPHPFTTALGRLNSEFINLKTLPNVRIDLRYNGLNNFMQEDLYQGFGEAYLHQWAFAKMQLASKTLARENPNLNFLVFDALRPRSVQKKMCRFVEHTPYKNYVADAELGSLHNFGMAIDLTLTDQDLRELDMGSEFDDFSELSQVKIEKQLLAAGKLSAQQIENRLLLRNVMQAAGFQQLPHEWWHYNALDSESVRKQIKIVE